MQYNTDSSANIDFKCTFHNLFNKPKDLNRIANIDYVYICLRDIENRLKILKW